jgi:hypothetical protein
MTIIGLFRDKRMFGLGQTYAVGDMNRDDIIEIIGSRPQLSAMTPTVITAGDIGCDGLADVIGSIDSTGVWFRNSVNGSWEQLSKYTTNCLANGKID